MTDTTVSSECPIQAWLANEPYDCSLPRGHAGDHNFVPPAPPPWHAAWEDAGRDGDGNQMLRYTDSGGMYVVLPVEDLK